MQRNTAVIALFAVVATGPAVAVEIHKCTDEQGRVTFSQQRCEGAEVSTIDLDVLPATGAGRPAIGSSAEYQAVTQRLADRMTNQKIRNAESRIEALAKERDDKILEYRTEMTRTGDYVAGINRAQRYAELITSTRASYDNRIATKQAEIETLRAQLHADGEQAQAQAE